MPQAEPACADSPASAAELSFSPAAQDQAAVDAGGVQTHAQTHVASEAGAATAMEVEQLPAGNAAPVTGINDAPDVGINAVHGSFTAAAEAPCGDVAEPSTRVPFVGATAVASPTATTIAAPRESATRDADMSDDAAISSDDAAAAITSGIDSGIDHDAAGTAGTAAGTNHDGAAAIEAAAAEAAGADAPDHDTAAWDSWQPEVAALADDAAKPQRRVPVHYRPPPPELIVLAANAKVGDLRRAIKVALSETYQIFDSFRVDWVYTAAAAQTPAAVPASVVPASGVGAVAASGVNVVGSGFGAVPYSGVSVVGSGVGGMGSGDGKDVSAPMQRLLDGAAALGGALGDARALGSNAGAVSNAGAHAMRDGDGNGDACNEASRQQQQQGEPFQQQQQQGEDARPRSGADAQQLESGGKHALQAQSGEDAQQLESGEDAVAKIAAAQIARQAMFLWNEAPVRDEERLDRLLPVHEVPSDATHHVDQVCPNISLCRAVFVGLRTCMPAVTVSRGNVCSGTSARINACTLHSHRCIPSDMQGVTLDGS